MSSKTITDSRSAYADKIEQQISQYRDVDNIHDLPDIFHYWSNRVLRPRLNSVISTDSVVEFYSNAFIRSAADCRGKAIFLSLGAGDCSLETEIAERLIGAGLVNFEFHCLELSTHLLERGRAKAEAVKVLEVMRFVSGDINSWKPEAKSYHGIMANHALHHFVELELIFSGIRHSLVPDGIFATCDMIGRNGHMRWPEVMTFVEGIWAFLPDRLRYNRQFSRLDRKFVNWDCSGEGFEGVRAQDILPLMVKNFAFHDFLSYGGLIDVFIDRGYGHNFDPACEQDRALIDFISSLNDTLIDTGVIKPTMMFATVGNSPGRTRRCFRHWTPEFCVRAPC